MTTKQSMTPKQRVLTAIAHRGRVPMNTRKRFHAVMNFQPFDRLPAIEWAN